MYSVRHWPQRLARAYGDAGTSHPHGARVLAQVVVRLDRLLSKDLIGFCDGVYTLSERGWPLANQVFLELTFLPEDLKDLTLATH